SLPVEAREDRGAGCSVEAVVVEEDVHPHLGGRAYHPTPSFGEGSSWKSPKGGRSRSRRPNPSLKERQPGRPFAESRVTDSAERHTFCRTGSGTVPATGLVGKRKRSPDIDPALDAGGHNAQVVGEEGHAAPAIEAAGQGAPRGSADNAG